MDFRGFLFLSRRMFSRISRQIFLSSFSWEKVLREIHQENPRQNPLNVIQQKSPDYSLQRGQAKN